MPPDTISYDHSVPLNHKIHEEQYPRESIFIWVQLLQLISEMRWIRGLKWYFSVILSISLFYLCFNMLNSPLGSDWLKPLNTASRKISSDLLDSLNVKSRMVSENFPINLPEHYRNKQYWVDVKGNSTGCLRYPALRDIHFSNSHWQKVCIFLWKIFQNSQQIHGPS